MLPHIAKGNNNLISGQFLHNNIKYKEMSTKKKLNIRKTLYFKISFALFSKILEPIQRVEACILHNKFGSRIPA